MSLGVAIASARATTFTGGIEIHVHEASRRLSTSGLVVTVLTTDTTGELPRDEQVSGYRVRRWTAYPRPKDYYFSPALAHHLACTRDYDVVHIQGIHSLVAPLALVAARRARIPAVLTFHTGGHSSGLRDSFRPLQWLRDLQLHGQVAKRLLVGATADECQPGTRGLRKDHRLSAQDAVVFGLRHAENSAEQPLCEFAHRHQGRSRTQQRCEEYRVSIRGFGPDERAELGTLVADADATCRLSEYEAHPISVMEAIGAGTNALFANTLGLSELGTAGLTTTIPLDPSPKEVAAAAAVAIAAAPLAVAPDLPDCDDGTDRPLKHHHEVAR